MNARRQKILLKIEDNLKIDNIQLISEYTTNKHKMSFMCSKGHSFKKAMGDFFKKPICQVCRGFSKENTLIRFRENISTDKYKILGKYSGSTKKILVECSKGHSYKVKPKSFNEGHRCSLCNRKGKYSETYFKCNPKEKNAYGELYSFEFSVKGRDYQMVGITKNWRNRKSGYSKLSPKEVRVTPMKLYDAFKLEQQFLKENDHLRPQESLGFSGWTECIRIEE